MNRCILDASRRAPLDDTAPAQNKSIFRGSWSERSGQHWSGRARQSRHGSAALSIFAIALTALIPLGCSSNNGDRDPANEDANSVQSGGARISTSSSSDKSNATSSGGKNNSATSSTGSKGVGTSSKNGNAASSTGGNDNTTSSTSGNSTDISSGGTGNETAANSKNSGFLRGGTGGASSASGTRSANGGTSQSASRSAAAGGTKSIGGSSSQSSKATGGATTSTTSSVGSGSGTCTPPAVGTSGTNPLFTDVFTADPAALVDNCTFYIQAGHDEGAGNYFTMYEWYLLKSTDMVHWTKSVGMRYTVFSWAHGNAWAGQMVRKGSKYYWYVPVEQGNGNGQMAIGVAVADSPEGPFKDAIGAPLVDDAFERKNMGFASDGDTPYTIDPTVFVDDDGQAYLHYGGFSRLVNAKLGDDMISISGTMKESTPSCYFESPYLIKRNATYYEIYACGANPPTIDYATSSSPLGPWTRKGTVLPKMTTLAGQDAATNHAGVAEFAGQWYVVYHVSNGPNGGGTYHRQVAIDKLNFNADGTIQQVKPSSGLSF